MPVSAQLGFSFDKINLRNSILLNFMNLWYYTLAFPSLIIELSLQTITKVCTHAYAYVKHLRFHTIANTSIRKHYHATGLNMETHTNKHILK